MRPCSGHRRAHQSSSASPTARVADVIGVATSAARESRNGQEFIDRVREECGIDARIIEGSKRAASSTSAPARSSTSAVDARSSSTSAAAPSSSSSPTAAASTSSTPASSASDASTSSSSRRTRRRRPSSTLCVPTSAPRSSSSFGAVRKRGFDLGPRHERHAPAPSRAPPPPEPEARRRVPRRDPRRSHHAAFAAVTADERGSLPWRRRQATRRADPRGRRATADHPRELRWRRVYVHATRPSAKAIIDYLDAELASGRG
ncbi:MAG: hypothetical protein H6700_01625 [Myxococcales bacterium]|nr:hypothetical protein [Myxococcales bacterium]